ncbi:MAG: nucleotide exchange factor GrpE [Eubacterium sp.]|nr:nucleotide exchange factor GrpE [Eubacterium sp.]
MEDKKEQAAETTAGMEEEKVPTTEETEAGTADGEAVNKSEAAEAKADQAKKPAEEKESPENDGQKDSAWKAEEAEKKTEEAGPDDKDKAVDAEFESVDGKGEKKSFFKKKKDKKDEKIEELTDRVTRQMAEFDNFRKRTEKEKSQMYSMGARDVIEKMLPIVDNFERGLANAPEGDAFTDGMKQIYKQLMKQLEDLGVKPIEAEGKEFDPNFHNAVMHCEDDSVGENIVVQELQKGYLYKDAVVRHSMVKVAN